MNQEFFFKADMIQAKTLSRLTWGTCGEQPGFKY